MRAAQASQALMLGGTQPPAEEGPGTRPAAEAAAGSRLVEAAAVRLSLQEGCRALRQRTVPEI
jgi:hypothetical protein